MRFICALLMCLVVAVGPLKVDGFTATETAPKLKEVANYTFGYDLTAGGLLSYSEDHNTVFGFASQDGNKLTAVNLTDGKVLWQKDVSHRGFGGTVVQAMGNVAVHIFYQRGESPGERRYLMQQMTGYDLANGTKLWTHSGLDKTLWYEYGTQYVADGTAYVVSNAGSFTGFGTYSVLDLSTGNMSVANRQYTAVLRRGDVIFTVNVSYESNTTTWMAFKAPTGEVLWNFTTAPIKQMPLVSLFDVTDTYLLGSFGWTAPYRYNAGIGEVWALDPRTGKLLNSVKMFGVSNPISNFPMATISGDIFFIQMGPPNSGPRPDTNVVWNIATGKILFNESAYEGTYNQLKFTDGVMWYNNQTSGVLSFGSLSPDGSRIDWAHVPSYSNTSNVTREGIQESFFAGPFVAVGPASSSPYGYGLWDVHHPTAGALFSDRFHYPSRNAIFEKETGRLIFPTDVGVSIFQYYHR